MPLKPGDISLRAARQQVMSHGGDRFRNAAKRQKTSSNCRSHDPRTICGRNWTSTTLRVHRYRPKRHDALKSSFDTLSACLPNGFVSLSDLSAVVAYTAIKCPTDCPLSSPLSTQAAVLLL